MPGGETRTDWGRPLSPAQLRYALDDVRYLLELADRLGSELERMGRAGWAEAEFADFLSAIENRADLERWRRLPGLQHLNRGGSRRRGGWQSGGRMRLAARTGQCAR